MTKRMVDMTFSDEDLKQLKERLTNEPSFDNYLLVPLLARLDAAEVIVHNHIKDEGQSNGCDAVKAWRKACGCT